MAMFSTVKTLLVADIGGMHSRFALFFDGYCRARAFRKLVPFAERQIRHAKRVEYVRHDAPSGGYRVVCGIIHRKFGAGRRGCFRHS
jgi:hypothetical protein